VERYERNGIITEKEQEFLKSANVCVLGCGGLGGYIIEMISRFGIGHITVVDGDVFNVSNLNRQILCTLNTLGRAKAFTAAERLEIIDPSIEVKVLSVFVNEDNVNDIITGHDLIIDALDSNAVRRIVLKACQTLKIPFVHGAIAGWYGQLCTIFPEDTFFRDYLREAQASGIETKIGNPSFTPALMASYQVSEAIKVLLNRGSLVREQLMYFDLFNNEIEIIRGK